MRHLVIASVLCTTVVSAQAESAACAELSNLQFILQDLNPGDGIAPSLTYSFVQNRGSSSSARYIYQSPAETVSNASWGQGLAGFVTNTVGTEFVYAIGVVPGGDVWGSGAAAYTKAFAYPRPTGTQNSVDSKASIGSPSTAGADFVLSPYTSVTFTGWVTAYAQASRVSPTELAAATVKLSYIRGSSLQQQAVLSAQAGGLSPTSTDYKEGQLTLVVTNNKATPLSFVFQALSMSNASTTLGGPL